MKLVVLVCGVLAGGSLAQAQDQPPEAPAKVLQIIREEIKSGLATAHEKFESNYVKAFKNAGRAPYLAMSTLTGRSEAWFLMFFPSYAAIENENEAVAKNTALSAELARIDQGDAEYRVGGATVVAEYKPELSYWARGDIRGLHYVEVTIVQVRLGHTREYEDMVALSKKAHEQAGVDEHFAIYEVQSGMPTGTYIVFVGLSSLSELDTDPHTQAYRDAVGDEGRAKQQKAIADAVLSADRMLFQFSPRMSNPPAWLTKADPEFWATPKPVVRPALPTSKP